MNVVLEVTRIADRTMPTFCHCDKCTSNCGLRIAEPETNEICRLCTQGKHLTVAKTTATTTTADVDKKDCMCGKCAVDCGIRIPKNHATGICDFCTQNKHKGFMKNG